MGRKVSLLTFREVCSISGVKLDEKGDNLYAGLATSQYLNGAWRVVLPKATAVAKSNFAQEALRAMRTSKKTGAIPRAGGRRDRCRQATG